MSFLRRRYCVFGCADLGAYMHSFPHPDKRSEMFKKWVSIVGDKLKETDPLKIHRNKRICDYHFTPDQKVASHRLMVSAVPCQYLDGVILSPAILLQLEHNYCAPGVHHTGSIANESANSGSSTMIVPNTELHARLNPVIDQASTSQLTASDKDSHTTLHLFPNPDKERDRFNTWVFSVKGDIIGLRNEEIYKLRQVCHAHFEDKFCCRNNRISKNAVPTLNLPGSVALPKFSFVERRPIRQRDISEPTPSTSASSADHQMETIYKKHDIKVYASLKEKRNKTINIDSAVVQPQQGLEANKENIVIIDASIKQSVHSLEPNKEKTSENKGSKFSFSQRRPMGQIQDNSEPTSSATVSSAGLQMGSPTIKEHIGKKENIDPVVQLQTTLEPNKAKSRNIGPAMSQSSPLTRKPKQEKRSKAGCFKGKIVKKNVTVTPEERKLYEKLVQTRIKLSKCRNKVKQQSASLKAAKNITANPAFLATLENFHSAAKIFTVMQFREHKKKNKGRRFSLEEKIMALSILKRAPKGYRLLRKLFILPAPQTLAKLISQANVTPGINRKVFQQLKNVTKDMKTEEKLCILMFDEMFLKASISYNERKDQAVGFVTDGQETKSDFADHAQVYMVRGLIKNYKQPVSYSFSAAATSGQQIAKELKDIFEELQEAGLIVVATVCDQGANNRQAIKLLLQETRGYYLRNGKEPKNNVIFINGTEVIPLYDPPHLLKCIRNNLMTKNLEYTVNGVKKTAKWEHIERLHQENSGYKGVRLLPKLTDGHVIPNKISKMKVKFASQVMSRTVGTNMGYLAGKGILPKECSDTADTILFLIIFLIHKMEALIKSKQPTENHFLELLLLTLPTTLSGQKLLKH